MPGYDEGTQGPPRVFLCHAKADKRAVRRLYHRLRGDGLNPWFDEADLLPGSRWGNEIPRAIRASKAVIVCLSRDAVSQAGYVHKEIKYALDVADEQPEDKIFIIPARLDDCPVPDRLRDFHWLDLFEDQGYEQLLRATFGELPIEQVDEANK